MTLTSGPLTWQPVARRPSTSPADAIVTEQVVVQVGVVILPEPEILVTTMVLPPCYNPP